RQRRGRLGGERRLVEVEQHGIQRALRGRRSRLLLRGAEAVHAVLVLRAVVLGLAGLLRAAAPGDAMLPAWALLVAGAGAAVVGDALLVGGALGLAAAVAGDGRALARLALVAGRTVVRV